MPLTRIPQLRGLGDWQVIVVERREYKVAAVPYSLTLFARAGTGDVSTAHNSRFQRGGACGNWSAAMAIAMAPETCLSPPSSSLLPQGQS